MDILRGKRKAGRSIAISDEIADALAIHMGDRIGRVFLNQREQPFDANGISMAVRRLYKQAGVEGSCYSGRRTLATRLVDQGINILVIQNVLGHSSPSTTMNYCEVTPKMIAAALFD